MTVETAGMPHFYMVKLIRQEFRWIQIVIIRREYKPEVVGK